MTYTENTTKISSETSLKKGNAGQGPAAPNGAPLLQEETNLQEEALSDWENFLEELSLICYGHKDLAALGKKETGALRAEGKKIRDLGFEVADLRLWFSKVWFADWRWKKDGERPKPSHVRSSLPRIDVDEQAERRSEYGAYSTRYEGPAGKGYSA